MDQVFLSFSLDEQPITRAVNSSHCQELLEQVSILNYGLSKCNWNLFIHLFIDICFNLCSNLSVLFAKHVV